ncbi:MAG TPA: hypothetical protein VFW45_10170, partial [Candidatus Polarisedimenticolia bacterium]|nr:hypothetical protein [Candidatus Polarisedimenticolia bacterium]
CIGYGWATHVIGNASEGCGSTLDGTGYNVRQNDGDNGPLHCATDCSGVREADYGKHNPTGPDTPQNFVCTSCGTSAFGGPCGREAHCETAPINQAAWDLVNRDFPITPFNYDSATAYNIASRLFYQGSANIGSWYTCSCGALADGCNGDSGYIQWITADDDNGNLFDGTPHMTAIYNAFSRHSIACSAPAPIMNGGCSGGPTLAPTFVAKGGALKADMCWSADTAASNYWVFKTDGQAGCDSGRTRIATLSGTTRTFTDTEVAEGRPYCYSVMPAGTTDKCAGASSNCVCVTPTTTVPPPNPEVTASTDHQTIWGTIFSGSVVNTRVSDNSNEVLKEALVGGVSKLSHIWKFINVPSGCWTLRFEGNRPSNNESDNFKFSWAPDVGGSPGTFTDIAGAVIDKGFDPAGGLTASFNGTAPGSTIYIKIQDTNQTSGTGLDKVNIDYLGIIVP